MRGKFIVIEGPNLAGKSTLIKKLATKLAALGISVVCTKEPGGSPFGMALRGVIKDPELHAGGFASALVFEGGRRDNLDRVVLPALAEGKVVLCDRYRDSTDVYQCILAEPRPTPIEVKILRALHGTFANPDLTIFLLPSKAVRDSRGADIDDRFADAENEYAAYESVATTAGAGQALTLVLRVDLENTESVFSAALAGVQMLGVI
jgi:dTMP kinase